MIGPQNRWVNHFMALQCMRAALRRNPPTMFFPWPAPPDHQHSGFLIVPIVKGAKAIKESWRKNGWSQGYLDGRTWSCSSRISWKPVYSYRNAQQSFAVFSPWSTICYVAVLYYHKGATIHMIYTYIHLPWPKNEEPSRSWAPSFFL